MDSNSALNQPEHSYFALAVGLMKYLEDKITKLSLCDFPNLKGVLRAVATLH